MENITLPISLGIRVWEELEKKGINKRKDERGILSFDFTPEEIGMIKKLIIKNPVPGALIGVSKLTSLETLSVTRDVKKINGYSMPCTGCYSSRDEYTSKKNRFTISDEDIMEVERCTKLRELNITGQPDITFVDVSRMPNLEYLDISNNMFLEEITGLDKLHRLENLSLWGNEQLMNIEGLNECVKEGLKDQRLDKLKLDTQLFPKLVKHNPYRRMEDIELIEMMKKASYDHDCDMSFIEKFGASQEIKIGFQPMLQMHVKAKKIVKNLRSVESNLGIREKVAMTEIYLADNVIYDENACDSGSHSHSEDGLIKGPLKGANGAYNCLMYNTCVCEGYSRGMQYLLTLQGVYSRNVHCIAEQDNLKLSDGSIKQDKYGKIELPDDGYHSILLVENTESAIAGYCDPCWDAEYYQKGFKDLEYMLLSKDEINKDHTLSFAEENIGSNYPVQYNGGKGAFVKRMIEQYKENKEKNEKDK